MRTDRPCGITRSTATRSHGPTPTCMTAEASTRYPPNPTAKWRTITSYVTAPASRNCLQPYKCHTLLSCRSTRSCSMAPFTTTLNQVLASPCTYCVAARNRLSSQLHTDFSCSHRLLPHPSQCRHRRTNVALPAVGQFGPGARHSGREQLAQPDSRWRLRDVRAKGDLPPKPDNPKQCARNWQQLAR